MHPIRNRILGFLAVTVLFTVPMAAQACAVCYGQSDSPMAQGMNWGIMSLLAVIGCVLGGIVSFFVYVGVKAGRNSSPSAGLPAHRN